MKLYLYSLKNRLSGIYERPVAEVYDPVQYLESLAQSLALAEVPVLERYKEFDVYCLGVLESKSGEISPAVDFVGSIEGVCLQYINAKKVKENVGEEDSRA